MGYSSSFEEFGADAMTEETELMFVEALMRHIIDQVNIPKVQVERAVGPILGMFIDKALSKHLGADVKMICAEFPLRKKDRGDWQSSNIDWLLYNATDRELVFLELKTAGTIEKEQAHFYLSLIEEIAPNTSSLVSTVDGIHKASRAKNKYDEVLACIEPRERFSDCTRARLVYLVPKWRRANWSDVLNGNATILSFEDLREDIGTEFPRIWAVIRKYLLQLDSAPSRSGDGQDESVENQNFEAKCSFEEAVRLCQESPDAIVVGFDGGIKKLAGASLDQLKTRRAYKWDYVEGGTGVKDSRNWISAEEFLKVVAILKRGIDDQTPS